MASRFWVGGTGNWDAADTTHWAASSGGAGGASVPGASDDVTFDGSSGGGTVTVTATVTVNSMTGGAHTGTLDTNGQTINTGTFSWSGTGTRTLTFGASAINISGGTNAYTCSTSTNLTVNPGTSTITFTNSGAQLFSGGKTLYAVVFSGGGSQIATSGGDLTCTNLTLTGTAIKTENHQFFGNPIVTGTFTANGNSSTNRILIRSNTLGTARTITAAAISISNADFRDITGAGAANWDLSAITGLSGDCGGNSGITFTTAATQTYTGGTDNWSTAAKWTSRVPLPQDDVSMSGVTGGTITADMPRLGKSIDWTGASGGPTYAQSVATTVYGSWTNISAMSFTNASGTTFEGRSSFTLTSAGKSFSANPVISMVGGTLTLQDAFSQVSGTLLTINNGTFNANGNSVTLVGFNSSNSNTRGITLGSGIWSLVLNSGTAWNIATTTGLTFNSSGSTILVSDTGASNKTFAGGGLTYNDLKINGGGAGAVIITGANTFNRIYTDGGGTKTITFPASTTTTLSYTGTDNFGNGNHLLTIASSSGGSAFTISKPVGRFEADHLNLTDSTATGTFYAGEHSVNVSGNSGWIFSAFSPNQSGGLTMWLDALDGGDGTFTDRLNKTAYTATSVTRGANINDGTEMIFNGTSSKIECGNIGEIYSITLWVKPGTNACSLIDFNGTEYISTVSGTVTATSWTSPTIYVNGVVTSVLPTGVWSHVAVTSSTSVTASAVILGLIGSTYGDCSLTNIKMYDRVLSATDIGRQVPSFPSANRALLQDLVDYTGLTFYKNYGLPNINSVNADYASGSATGTWTVTRGTTTPATYCDADGTIQLVTGTNPRFTQGFYNSTGFVSRPGLIVEGASTNSIRDSAFENSTITTNWIAVGGTLSRSTDYTNPYGGGSVAKHVCTAADDRFGVNIGGGYTINVTSGTVYTVSALVRSTTTDPLYFRYSDGVIQTSGNYTPSTTAWTLIQWQVTAGATTGISGLSIANKNAVSRTFYVAYMQFEALPFASTFIPTTTAALTRNAETLTYPISGNRTAATESLFVKFTPLFTATQLTVNRNVISTSSKERDIGVSQSGDDIYFRPNATDTPTANIRTGVGGVSPIFGTSYVVAGIAISPTGNPNEAIYVDGTSYDSTTTVNTDWTSPAFGLSMYVGSSAVPDQQLHGIISSLAIFSDAKNATAVAGITDLLEAL